MRIIIIIITALLLSNCTSSYVKNKKVITSPKDLQKFVNAYCNKSEKQTDKVIVVCGSAFSKDLQIAENKAVLSAKLKIADITQHTLVRSEKITHKERNKTVTKSYDMTAENQLFEATIVGYRIVHKKFVREQNGWRAMVIIEYKLT